MIGADLGGVDAVRQLFDSLRFTVLVSLLGLPAAVVPIVAGTGTPRAVQIVGPRFGEQSCLEAAAAVEQRLGAMAPIDPT